MKKVVLWILGISLICLGIGLAIFSREGRFNCAEKNIDVTKNYSIADINNINVESTSADIKIDQIEGDQVQVRYYGKIYSNENIEPTVNLNQADDNLNIKSGMPVSKLSFTSMKDFKLEIGLPKKDLQKLAAKTSSGDLEINAGSAEKLEAESTTGDISITDFVAEQSIKTTTGNVKISDSVLQHDKTIASTTGDINLFLPKDSSFNLQYSTSTGSLSNSLGIIINQTDKRHATGTLGDGKHNISVDTTTGDLIF